VGGAKQSLPTVADEPPSCSILTPPPALPSGRHGGGARGAEHALATVGEHACGSGHSSNADYSPPLVPLPTDWNADAFRQSRAALHGRRALRASGDDEGASRRSAEEEGVSAYALPESMWGQQSLGGGATWNEPWAQATWPRDDGGEADGADARLGEPRASGERHSSERHSSERASERMSERLSERSERSPSPLETSRLQQERLDRMIADAGHIDISDSENASSLRNLPAWASEGQPKAHPSNGHDGAAAASESLEMDVALMGMSAKERVLAKKELRKRHAEAARVGDLASARRTYFQERVLADHAQRSQYLGSLPSYSERSAVKLGEAR
jgi:hypothetical protein